MKNDDEFDLVIEEMRKDFPQVVEYNMIDDDLVEILDANDNVIGKITAENLTRYWNNVEGF